MENNTYNIDFGYIFETEIVNIQKSYKIINVPYIDTQIVTQKMFTGYTEQQKQNVLNIVNFCLNDKNKRLYKKIDYLCSKKNKICICNINADNLRKIYDGHNYVKNQYIVYVDEINDKL